VSLWELSSHYNPVESVGRCLAPPPNKLAAVAEEVEVENGGGGWPRRKEMRDERKGAERNRYYLKVLYNRALCDI
jgi:hypothetical protein